ncbi:hypothetical protein [Streptomyces sp. NPDC013457]|uniref:hypothetical protein n=1 Tax=Streptomyces sp. NPDC013457 TaxID=3364866 RepID=UPI0036FE8F6D
MERAGHLLSPSALPNPAVAAAVGIGDPEASDKACGRELGVSPRVVRAGGRA